MKTESAKQLQQSTSNMSDAFMTRAVSVAKPLCNAFRGLIKHTEQRSSSSRSLPGLHGSIRSRLGRALSTDNPLASLYRLPGPDGLRRVVDASLVAGAEPSLVAACQKQIAAYEQFFEEEQLSRELLHAMLAGYLPEARDVIFRTNCQAAFRAHSNIAGHYAETGIYSMLVFPGTEPGRCSVASLHGCRGWRRLRQDCMYAVHGYTKTDSETASRQNQNVTDLEGNPVASLGRTPLLEEYCSKPTPEFKRIDLPHACNYYLVSREVGVRSTCDLMLGEIHTNNEPMHRTSTQTHFLAWVVTSTPCKFMLFDLFVHADIWPDSVPTVECFNTVPLGPLRAVDDHALRENDRIQLGVSMRQILPRLGAVETSAVHDYGQMTNDVAGRLGHSMDEFRGFRCEIPYPLHGAQVMYRIELPAEDQSA